MKVRMSYEIDIDRIPYEMNKAKEEITSLLNGVVETLASKDVTDVEGTEDLKVVLSGCQRDLAQANDKVVALSQYVDNNKQISDRLKEEEIETRAQEIVEERTSLIKEELEKILTERTEEFNSLIKEREEIILDLRDKLAATEKPAPKKKTSRKKKSTVS